MITNGFHKIFTGMRWIAAFMLFVATVITAFNTITRYLLGFVIYGSEELCAYIVLLMAYMLFPIMETENHHLKIDIFSSSSVNQKLKNAVYVVRGIITIFIFAVLCYYGWQVISTAAKFQSASPSLRIPKAYVFGLMETFFVITVLGWLCILFINKRRPL